MVDAGRELVGWSLDRWPRHQHRSMGYRVGAAVHAALHRLHSLGVGGAASPCEKWSSFASWAYSRPVVAAYASIKLKRVGIPVDIPPPGPTSCAGWANNAVNMVVTPGLLRSSVFASPGVGGLTLLQTPFRTFAVLTALDKRALEAGF